MDLSRRLVSAVHAASPPWDAPGGHRRVPRAGTAHVAVHCVPRSLFQQFLYGLTYSSWFQTGECRDGDAGAGG